MDEMEARELALDRIRTLLGEQGVSERRMFGGNAFMYRGNMVAGLMGTGELMIRVGPDAYEEAPQEPHTRPMDFTGRPMKGYVYVEDAGWSDDAALAAWLDRGKAFASTLPPK